MAKQASGNSSAAVKKFLLIDNQFLVLVPEDKLELVKAVTAHFQPRWNAKAHKDGSSNDYPIEMIKNFITYCLGPKMLDIDFEIVDFSGVVSIYEQTNTSAQETSVETEVSEPEVVLDDLPDIPTQFGSETV